MVITDGRDPARFEGPQNSLSLAFSSGVYVTGGADLHVEGKIYADEIATVDSIVGESGSMVITDGRDPARFEGPQNSLSLAFSSGVYITGGNGLFSEEIKGVKGIISKTGLVITDGREHQRFQGPEESLSLAFASGVYITGGGSIYVEGKISAEEIEAVDSIIGQSGSMVITDGSDPARFEGPQNSLSLAFESGVHVTGGSFYAPTGYFEEIYVSRGSLNSSTYYQEVDSSFWWSSEHSGVYIPLNSSEHNHVISHLENNEPDGLGEGSFLSGMRMHHIRLMPSKGKIKKITFSISKTNPYGLKDTQFNIIKGKYLEFDCPQTSQSAKESSTKIIFINEFGEEEVNIVERSDFEFPTWEDKYYIYGAREKSTNTIYNVYPCCPSPVHEPEELTNPTESTHSTLRFQTPQKYVKYSYEFQEEFHYNAGEYISIVMDKGGEIGPDCEEGNIDQAIFVSILFENQIN